MTCIPLRIEEKLQKYGKYWNQLKRIRKVKFLSSDLINEFTGKCNLTDLIRQFIRLREFVIVTNMMSYTCLTKMKI